MSSITTSLLPSGSDGEVPDIDSVIRKSGLEDKRSNINGAVKSRPGEPTKHGVNGTRVHTDLHAIPLHDQFAFTPRKIRVITVGAGFSGLMMAHKFQHRFPVTQHFTEHKIFEARSDIGGTWAVNTYPGVQCDVPSHIYTFPFEPSPEWSRFYSSGHEIHDYIKRTANKWNLTRDVHLNTKVTSAVWKEEIGQWEVTVESEGIQRVEYAEVLISAQGVLDSYKWPNISGIESFAGQRVHSADWDHSFDYSHKRVAVIGNGSSGVQIVPQLVNLPGTTITNFARGSAWIYYRVPPSQHLGGETKDKNPAYSEEQKNQFRRNPESLKQHRKAMISRTNRAFKMVSIHHSTLVSASLL